MAWRPLRDRAEEIARRCDVVHIQTPFVAHYAGLRAARRHGLPAVTTYHTLFEEYLHHYAPLVPDTWLRGLSRRMSRGQCNAADAVVVPSSAMRERLAHYGVRSAMHVLPTGIPAAAFGHADGARFRRAHGIDPDRPIALFVGRVAFEKNIDFLLRMAQRLGATTPRPILLVTGAGPAVPSLQALAARLGLGDTVRFLGYLDRARDLPDCYAAANVFVFASRTETQGLVLLEAMACGTPVVALSVMGTRDILEPRRGCLVARDDVDDFARQVGRVLSEPGLRARLSIEARAFAAAWDDIALAERLAEIYRGLLPRRAKGSRAATVEA